MKKSIQHFESPCRKYTAILVALFPSSCAVCLMYSENFPVYGQGKPGILQSMGLQRVGHD